MLSPGCDSRVFQLSLAEALHRCWLYKNWGHQGENLKRQLQRVADKGSLSHDQLQSYLAWLQYMNSGARISQLPNELKGHGCWDHLRTFLTAWNRSNGSVIFVARHGELSETQGAFVTPFFFEESHENRLVVDSRHRSWQSLESVISNALVSPLKNRTVVFPLLDQFDVGDLHAGSAALPIAFAVEHNLRQQFGYRALKFLATGACESENLAAISHGDLKAELAERVGASLFFFPSDSVSTSVRSSKTRLQSLELESMPNALQKILIELGSEGIGPKLTNKAIDTTLLKTEWDLKLGQRPAGNILEDLNSLECILSSQEMRSPKRLIHLKVLKASALCHIGESEKANDILENCTSDARLQKKIPFLCTAVAQHIVALNDLCQFEQAKKIAEDQLAMLEEEREDFDDDEYLDARMRLFGSLGQTFMAWSLKDGDYQTEAKDCLDKALEAAEELSPRKDSGDVFKDLNYLALWKACFEPHSISDCFDTIKARMDRATEFPTVSYQHLLRIRLLANYRQYLLTGMLPQTLSELPSANPESWVRAISCKYLGTLQAAKGDFESSFATFHEGLEIFQEEGAPLLQFFGFTLCVQAKRSLALVEQDRCPNLDQEARRFLASAKRHLPKNFMADWINWKSSENAVKAMLSMFY